MNLRIDKKDITDYNSEPYDNVLSYYGIVDDNGIDQIYNKDDNTNIHNLKLRCRFNSHRNGRIFACLIKE
jgi:hypothetical protein